MWPVVRAPGDRQFQKRGFLAEGRGLVGPYDIAAAHPVGLRVVAHHRAVIGEASLQQQLDGMLRKVPGGRAVAVRPGVRQRLDGGDTPVELLRFFLPRQLGRRDMPPAVMADLVAGLVDAPAMIRPCADGDARNEEGSRDGVAVQKPQYALDPDRAELAARKHGWRGPAPGDEARHAVEIECERGKAGRHPPISSDQGRPRTDAARPPSTTSSVPVM